MPGMDGTGPMGMGPMTGGGRGFCNPLWAGSGYRGAMNPWLRYHGYSPWAGYGYGPHPWRFRATFPYGAAYFGWPQRGYGASPWPFSGYPY